MAAQTYHVRSDRRRLMALRLRIAGLLLAAACLGPAAAQTAETVTVVEPGGPGVLTKCRNWVVATACHTYHHIALPSRIAVGDRINITFGSSPKEYDFPVARIALRRHRCVIFSEANGNPQEVDKIQINPCYRVNNTE
jgi:hypothetical protein